PPLRAAPTNRLPRRGRPQWRPALPHSNGLHPCPTRSKHRIFPHFSRRRPNQPNYIPPPAGPIRIAGYSASDGGAAVSSATDPSPTGELVVRNGKRKGTRLPLRHPATVIGSADGC